jgi:patatin-like phospholipase/acyl hydrolase
MKMAGQCFLKKTIKKVDFFENFEKYFPDCSTTDNETRQKNVISSIINKHI